MKLHSLNEKGIDRFDQLRDSIASGAAAPECLGDILENTAYARTMNTDIDVVPRQFPTRFSVGRYFNGLFNGSPAPDRGVWTWLAAFHFEQLCPPGQSPGNRARWVPEASNFCKYYRHLLAGPYQIYRTHRTHPQRAMVVLANPPYRPGELAEQLTSRQELVTNPSVMALATRLYINSETNTPKKGAARQGSGSVRRLVNILYQLSMTWDLHAIDTEQLLDMLPAEFDQFKS